MKTMAKVKVEKTRLRDKHAPAKDPRVLAVFFAGLFLIGLSTLAGFLLSQNAIAGARGLGQWDWNYERVRFFESYKVNGFNIGGKSRDGVTIAGLPTTTEGPCKGVKWCFYGGPTSGIPVGTDGAGKQFITNWNPIDQEYALGYIDFGTDPIPIRDENGKIQYDEYGFPEFKAIWWYCSAHTYFPEITKSSERKEQGLNWSSGKYAGKRSSGESCYFPGGKNEKNEFNYVDQINGAQYMGMLYDVRRYAWSAVNSENFHISFYHAAGRPYGPSSRSGNDERTVTIYEFHFYPAGTLDKLDRQLVYDTITYQLTTPKCLEYNKKTGACIKWKYTDTTDAYVHRNGPSLYYEEDLGVSCDLSPNTLDTNIICNTSQYQAWLREQEDSLGILESDGKEYDYHRGVFKGFIKIDDIDGNPPVYPEGWTPLLGGYKVWLTPKTNIRTSDRVFSSRKPASYRSGKKNAEGKNWYSSYCDGVNNSDKALCREWVGTVGCGPAQASCAIYLAFRSTSDEPFTIAYHTTGHGSSMTSEKNSITYVIDGDIDDDDIIQAIEQFQTEYYDMYGQTVAAAIEEKGIDAESDQVLRILHITHGGYYNPYMINKYLDKVSMNSKAKDLCWYATREELNSDTSNTCAKALPDDDSNPQVITGNVVYYGSFERIRYTNFDSTCTSGNDERIQTNRLPEGLKEN